MINRPKLHLIFLSLLIGSIGFVPSYEAFSCRDICRGIWLHSSTISNIVLSVMGGHSISIAQHAVLQAQVNTEQFANIAAFMAVEAKDLIKDFQLTMEQKVNNEEKLMATGIILLAAGTVIKAKFEENIQYKLELQRQKHLDNLVLVSLVYVITSAICLFAIYSIFKR